MCIPKRFVRFIIRDLSGKYCFDFVPAEEENCSGQVVATSDCPETPRHAKYMEDLQETPDATEEDESNVARDALIKDDPQLVTSVYKYPVESVEPEQQNKEQLNGAPDSHQETENDTFVSNDEDEKTEHGDVTTSTKYDILDYLDGPTADPKRIPNALNDVSS